MKKIYCIITALALLVAFNVQANDEFNERSHLVHIQYGATPGDEVKFDNCPFVVSHGGGTLHASTLCSMKVPDPRVHRRITELFDTDGNVLYNVKFNTPNGTEGRVCDIDPEAPIADAQTTIRKSTLWFTQNVDELTGEMITYLHGQLTCFGARPQPQ